MSFVEKSFVPFFNSIVNTFVSTASIYLMFVKIILVIFMNCHLRTDFWPFADLNAPTFQQYFLDNWTLIYNNFTPLESKPCLLGGVKIL